MKVWLIVLIAVFSTLIAVDSWGQTITEEDTFTQKDSSNLCPKITATKKTSSEREDAPPPVRTLEDTNSNTAKINPSEVILYQELGLISSRDGSYVCLATDTNNPRREFTIFKVKKIDNILVASAFLEGGNFLAGQEKATTDLFLEIIQFYTNIPQEYYAGIDRYFQEFYLRMADGRLEPNSDIVYAIDEPSATVIMYHPLQGEIKGTAISLNIYLP